MLFENQTKQHPSPNDAPNCLKDVGECRQVLNAPMTPQKCLKDVVGEMAVLYIRPTSPTKMLFVPSNNFFSRGFRKYNIVSKMLFGGKIVCQAHASTDARHGNSRPPRSCRHPSTCSL